MTDAFDPEQALARWRALEDEKWRSLDVCRASWKADGLSGQEKLRLIKEWSNRVSEAQTEERARLLKHIHAARLSLQKIDGIGWSLVLLPPWLEENLREAEDAGSA